MASEKVEQHPATGTTLVVMVGLGIAFLLFIAFLNVVKSGNILSEANLLYASLVFYAGAGALYLGFGVTGTDAYIKFASLMTWAGLLANTGAVAHRWYEAGHPPFSGYVSPVRHRSSDEVAYPARAIPSVLGHPAQPTSPLTWPSCEYAGRTELWNSTNPGLLMTGTPYL